MSRAHETFYLGKKYARQVVQAFSQKDIYNLDLFGTQLMVHIGKKLYAIEKNGVLYLAQITRLADGVTVECQVATYPHHFIPASFKHNTKGETCLSTKNANLVFNAFRGRDALHPSFFDTKHMALICGTVDAEIYIIEKFGKVYMAQITRCNDGSIDCQVDSFCYHFG